LEKAKNKFELNMERRTRREENTWEELRRERVEEVVGKRRAVKTQIDRAQDLNFQRKVYIDGGYHDANDDGGGNSDNSEYAFPDSTSPCGGDHNRDSNSNREQNRVR
jgi:hypothetical protein